MIEVYSWATPNGHKVHIMLEECGLPYQAIAGGHRRRRAVQARVPGDQPEQQDPGHRRPRRARTASRSRCSSRARSCCTSPARPAASCPPTRAASYEVLQWLMFQMGGVGPMLGQAHHFRIYAPEKIALRDRPLHQRGQAPVRRDERAAGQEHATSPGRDYTIADIAIFPWLRSWKNQGIDWSDFPHLKGWFDEIARARRCMRGVEVLADRAPADHRRQGARACCSAPSSTCGTDRTLGWSARLPRIGREARSPICP